jgi:hypothetical protein
MRARIGLGLLLAGITALASSSYVPRENIEEVVDDTPAVVYVAPEEETDAGFEDEYDSGTDETDSKDDPNIELLKNWRYSHLEETIAEAGPDYARDLVGDNCNKKLGPYGIKKISDDGLRFRDDWGPSTFVSFYGGLIQGISNFCRDSHSVLMSLRGRLRSMSEYVLRQDGHQPELVDVHDRYDEAIGKAFDGEVIAWTSP